MEKFKKLFLLMAILIPATMLTACGGDDDDKDEPNVPNQTLLVGQTFTIPTGGTWTSDNSLIASVNAQTVKGVRVGEVAIRSEAKSFVVTVNPTITLFKDPYLGFGATSQQVKSYMSEFEVASESSSLITFFDRAKSVTYGYAFEASKLNMAMVIAPKKIATTSEISEYLSERYVFVTTENDYIGMVSPDKKTIIVFMVKIQSGKTVYAISYSPADNSKARSAGLDAAFKAMVDATPGEIVKGGMNLY